MSYTINTKYNDFCIYSTAEMNRINGLKNKTCCFSGHRIIPPEHYIKIAALLEETIVKSIEDGYKYFGTGGALGFDTLAALTVLKLKKQYPQIRLILVLPCKNQTRYWKQKEISEYELIKKSADKILFTSETYYNGCMQKRNRHLVDSSSRCICFLTKKTGGTAYTIDYAKSKNLEVIPISICTPKII